MNHVLIVDDDADSASTLRELVGADRFSIAVARSLRDARRQIALQQPHLVLLDLELPDGNGLELFSDPQFLGSSQVVIVTGHASLESSIEALRRGAVDYLVKPVAIGQLEKVLSRFTTGTPAPPASHTLANEVPAGSDRFGHLWGRAPAMRRLYEQIQRVAATSVTVFITGESGTGKEVVAQTVHEFSLRQSRPFLAVNCGAISPNLIESEIFGHEKGSFTGAERQHQGFFERAAGGTLFLDEITEMPLELQVKLLRVLETGCFMRVGSTQTHEANVRVIAATNRSPQEAVASGKLREDLLYRLNVFPIDLPPLRERLCDVPLLAEHFLQAISESEGAAKRFCPSAVQRLMEYPWPGNVRELRNVVQRAYVMAHGELINDAWLPRNASAADSVGEDRLPVVSTAQLGASGVPSSPEPFPKAEDATLSLPLGLSMAQAERLLIQATLKECKFQKERTAAILGISLKTLYNRLKEYAAENTEHMKFNQR